MTDYQYQRDIHKDCFKLRILVTNTCNQQCDYCLNDFQPIPWKRPKEPLDMNVLFNQFVDKTLAIQTAEEYVAICKEEGIKSEIYLSGGEPTLHPEYGQLVFGLKSLGPDKMVLCTNGLLNPAANQLFTELHISAHWNPVAPAYEPRSIEGEALWVASHIQRIKDWRRVDGMNRLVTLNCVFGDYPAHTEYECLSLRENTTLLMHAFSDQDLPSWVRWKVWANIHRAQDKAYMDGFNRFCTNNPSWINRGQSFAVQHNRGPICKGCTRDCVTLKAMWLFPDNTCSPCPQGEHPHVKLMVKSKQTGLNHAIKTIYEGHKCRRKNALPTDTNNG